MGRSANGSSTACRQRTSLNPDTTFQFPSAVNAVFSHIDSLINREAEKKSLGELISGKHLHVSQMHRAENRREKGQDRAAEPMRLVRSSVSQGNIAWDEEATVYKALLIESVRETLRYKAENRKLRAQVEKYQGLLNQSSKTLGSTNCGGLEKQIGGSSVQRLSPSAVSLPFSKNQPNSTSVRASPKASPSITASFADPCQSLEYSSSLSNSLSSVSTHSSLEAWMEDRMGSTHRRHHGLRHLTSSKCGTRLEVGGPSKEDRKGDETPWRTGTNYKRVDLCGEIALDLPKTPSNAEELIETSDETRLPSRNETAFLATKNESRTETAETSVEETSLLQALSVASSSNSSSETTGEVVNAMRKVDGFLERALKLSLALEQKEECKKRNSWHV